VSGSTAKTLMVSEGSEAVSPLDNTRLSERDHRKRSLAKTSPVGADARWRRQAKAAARETWYPGHVRACSNNPHRDARWTLAVWPKIRPEEHTRIAYTCSSYRCPSPECQKAAAHRDFAKIAEAVEAVPNREGWCYLVLTIDQRETLNPRRTTNAGWKDEQEAFRELSKMQRNFMSRLRRMFTRRGWESFENRWVSTVEIQGNGWPHLNLMIHSPDLASWLEEQAEGKENPRAIRGELLEHAIACDWGEVGVAERAKKVDSLTGYLVKKAADFGRQVGEIAKLCQAPTNARMKLRRIRAGKGFLRTREKNPEWTGIMLRRKRLLGSAFTYVEPLMKPDQVRCSEEEQPNYLAGASAAIRAEQWQADAESKGAEVRSIVSATEEKELARWGAYFERLASDETKNSRKTAAHDQTVGSRIGDVHFRPPDQACAHRDRGSGAESDGRMASREKAG